MTMIVVLALYIQGLSHASTCAAAFSFSSYQPTKIQILPNNSTIHWLGKSDRFKNLLFTQPHFIQVTSQSNKVFRVHEGELIRFQLKGMAAGAWSLIEHSLKADHLSFLDKLLQIITNDHIFILSPEDKITFSKKLVLKEFRHNEDDFIWAHKKLGFPVLSLPKNVNLQQWAEFFSHQPASRALIVREHKLSSPHAIR